MIVVMPLVRCVIVPVMVIVVGMVKPAHVEMGSGVMLMLFRR